VLNIQGAGRTKQIAGRRWDGTVEVIPDLLCARKHTIDKKGLKQLKKCPRVFCFVSSPKIYKEEAVRKISAGWCHGLRDESWLPKAPNILMPESDFMDKDFVYYDSDTRKKYDYFYFTINAKPGIENKGLHEFLTVLPVFTKMKLRGKIIVYYPNAGLQKKLVIQMTKDHRRNLRNAQHLLDFHWGFLKSSQMSEVMTASRFGFFPNTVDNSPRILAETLVRDVPVLVNKSIHGGWHYINEQTGHLFKRNNIREKLERMFDSFSPRDYWNENYGFEKSSRRLAQFLSQIFGIDEYSHAYFKDFSAYLERL